MYTKKRKPILQATVEVGANPGNSGLEVGANLNRDFPLEGAALKMDTVCSRVEE